MQMNPTFLAPAADYKQYFRLKHQNRRSVLLPNSETSCSDVPQPWPGMSPQLLISTAAFPTNPPPPFLDFSFNPSLRVVPAPASW